MKILVAGLNHRTAPLETREQLSLTRGQLGDALGALRDVVGRGVILSTCNRSEVYIVASEAQQGRNALDKFISGYFAVSPEELTPYMYYYQQKKAVEHLFRVSTSLDSMILGESQILGQVRDAYGAATRAGAAGGPLDKLFHQALRVGKRARRDTGIGRNALSVSRACVELARQALGDLRGRRVMVVGVGEAGKLAARALEDNGAGDIVVTNRTLERAQELAAELGGQAVAFDQWVSLLEEVDIVVSCTGSPGYVLTLEIARQALERRRLAKGSRRNSADHLFLIDIAVPRDIDPRVRELDSVHLYDIDDLEAVSAANRRERAREAKKVEAIIGEEVARFMEWQKSLAVVPTITQLRNQAEAVRQREVAKTLRRLSGLGEEEQRRIDALSRAIVKKLLHSPITSLRERKDLAHIQMARELFALDSRESS